ATTKDTKDTKDEAKGMLCVLRILCGSSALIGSLHADGHELFQTLVGLDERFVPLTETDTQLGAALSGILVEAARRHRGDAHTLHQIPGELDIVGESEAADVGHD